MHLAVFPAEVAGPAADLGHRLLDLLLLLGHCTLWQLLGLIGLWLQWLLGLLLICYPCCLHGRCCVHWYSHD